MAQQAQQPGPGRIVRFCLTADQAAQINQSRVEAVPGGAHGNRSTEGDVVPFIIVRVWPDEFGPGVPGVNGQAFLDGNDVLWVCSAKEGVGPGEWQWPPRA